MLTQHTSSLNLFSFVISITPYLPMSTPTPTPSSAATNSALTAEQLHRIEQNKRRAQERLQTKRKQSVSTKHGQHEHSLGPGYPSDNTLRPPPTKHPALQSHCVSPPNQMHHLKKLETSTQFRSSSSNSASSLANRHSNISPQFNLKHGTSKNMQSMPQSFVKSQSLPFSHAVDSHYSGTSSSGSCSGGPSSIEQPKPCAASSSSSSGKQCLQLKKIVKANFVMISKENFKVLVPFDAEVIEVFKKMKTRSYGKLKVFLKWLMFTSHNKREVQ